MWQRKASVGRKSASGVVKIRRDSYNTVNGFSQKNAWWDIVAKVRKRANGMCEAHISGKRCGAKGNECHHIIPLARGGTTTMPNLIYLCESCNNRRHNHLFRTRS